MNALELQLQQTVQHNCDISDARYARDYSMCVYLMRMQEHYRFQHAVPFNAPVDGETVGNWVRETEDYWDTIEEAEFQPLIIGGISHDPFDSDHVNRALSDSSLAYTAGIGRLGQPHFVLAQQVEHGTQPYPRLELGQELARDSITVPAMTRDGTIVIRHDSIKRMLRQMIAEWQLRKPNGPMSRLLQHYGIDKDQPGEETITQTATDLSTVLVHHEQGEILSTRLMGEDFLQMIIALQGRPAEGYVRAVGDLMADSMGTWPYLAEQQSNAHLDFWLAGLQGIRESLLQPTELYQQLCDSSNGLKVLPGFIESEQARWQQVARQLLDAFQQDGVHFDYKTTIETAAYTGS